MKERPRVCRHVSPRLTSVGVVTLVGVGLAALLTFVVGARPHEAAAALPVPAWRGPAPDAAVDLVSAGAAPAVGLATTDARSTAAASGTVSVYLPLVMRGYRLPLPRITLVARPTLLTATETSVLTATAFDCDGRPVPGVAVTFSTTDTLGGGALVPGAVATDASGQATATVRSTVEGPVRVTVQADGYENGSAYVYARLCTGCVPYAMAVVPTGFSAFGVALDTAGRRAFVAHSGGMMVIDMDSFAILAQVTSFSGTHGIAYDHDNDRIWVATRDGVGRVLVLDGATYGITRTVVRGDEPHSVAYNPGNDRVYVTNYGCDTVDVYVASTMWHEWEVGHVSKPSHLAVDPVVNKVYVANHTMNGGVTRIDGTLRDARRIGLPLADPYGVAVDVTRHVVYVTAVAEGRVAFVDSTNDALLAGWDVRRGDGRTPWLRPAAVNPGGGVNGHLFLVTTDPKTLASQFLLVPGAYPLPTTPIPLNIPGYPQEGIAFDPVAGRVWVTSVNGGVVTVIQDGETLCSTPF